MPKLQIILYSKWLKKLEASFSHSQNMSTAGQQGGLCGEQLPSGRPQPSWWEDLIQNMPVTVTEGKRTAEHILAPKCLSDSATGCFCSIAKLCLTFCNSVDCSSPSFSVLHHLQSLLKLMSIDSVMPSNHLVLLSPPSPPAFNLSQNQALIQWVRSSHQVTKVLEFQPQHQSFWWIFKVDFP